ncbi:TPA: hypothetical protein PXM13_004391 [Yersinia enterocolitica]|nr:hypothetical protein [Yersinia enterocolitica]HDL6939839.1 hypothetical protein [Yersinia enterocolitica]
MTEECSGRTEEERIEAVRIYEKYRQDSLDRQLSNSESYDKTVLTLSSAGLALSVALLNLLLPTSQIKYFYVLKTSWFCFSAAIILSLVAYRISNAAISKQLAIAESYYIDGDEAAFSRKNWLTVANKWVNRLLGIAFSIAIILVMIFASINFQPKEIGMSDKKNTSTTVRVKTQDSADTPSMQRISPASRAQNSADIPSMQAVPSSTSQKPTEQKKSSDK